MPTGEGTTAYPLTLTTPVGETTLVTRPERVAVLGGLGDLYAALALGISPVAANQDSADLAWLGPIADQVADTEKIDIWADAFEYEKVAAAKPDLIVALTLNPLADHFDKLASIAPVLGGDGKTEYDPGTNDADWRAIIRSIGSATDLAAASDAAITETEEHIDEVAENNPEFEGLTLAMIINRGEEYGVELLNNADSSTEDLLTSLGFAPHPHASEVTDALSLENIGLIDADLIYVYQHGGTADPEVGQEWLEASPLYQKLDAVKDERVVNESASDLVDGAMNLPWSLSYPDVLNLRAVVDLIEERVGPIAEK
jgi:iron complex transport system substrate-binding protein